MAMQVEGRGGGGNVTSNAANWRPGMTYRSPVTGKTTTDPSKIPGTAQYKAKQNATSSARTAQGYSAIVTYSGGNSGGGGNPSGQTYGGTSGGSGGGGGGGGSSAAAQYAAAQAAATRAANASARSSANSQKSQLQQAIDAATAQQQTNQKKLDSLSDLVKTGLKKGRDTQLGNISRDLKTLLDQAFASYGTQLGDINTGLRDNENAETDSSFSNLANRARERQDLVSAALSQGAGESDVLRTQLQALRNWSANQGDINRSYFDTLTSTNAALTDLNVGTKTNITGYELDANQRRGGVWQDYYSGMSDAYTQMDNLASNNWLLGREIAANQASMGAQDALIAHLDSGKNADDWVMPVTKATDPSKPFTGYSKKAAQFAGETWKSPGVSKATSSWEGQEAQEGALNTSQAWAAATNESAPTTKKPEGATLRRW